MKGFITVPSQIEKRSMEIIQEFLGDTSYSPAELSVVRRVIHTTADFEFAKILEFRNGPLKALTDALLEGVHIVTDTNMALAGINKRVPGKYGAEVKCYMGNEGVQREAGERGVTRAMVSMEWAARDRKNGIFVVGNAPTALMRLLELLDEGLVNPRVIIGVPVGFVGAAESKEILRECPVPSIITRGNKGGSNVAAAIVNAIAYLSLSEE